MNRMNFPLAVPLLVGVVLAMAGCDTPAAYFRANLVEMQLRQTDDEPLVDASPEAVERQRGVADVLLALFGNPDHPADPFVAEEGADEGRSPLQQFGFDVEKLRIAAGPVYSDAEGRQYGLYRLHCAHCHGVTGDGAGPTAAFLNPYPRDYRQGIFKFKSTFGDVKPTHDDLSRILMEGIPGTAMPSFRLLPDNELEALIEYVRYLSVRGETEIRLIEVLADEGELPSMEEIAGGFPIAMDDEGMPEEEPEYENIVASVVYSWQAASAKVIHPVTPQVDPNDAEQLAESIDRGRTMFYSQKVKCNSCHGDSALGDGEIGDYSAWFQWRKEIAQEPPEDIEQTVDVMMAVGALEPRTIHPRNLRLGVYRGGRRPIDLYRRVFSGIYGTPMPGQGAESGIAGDSVSEEEAGGAVSRQEIWDIVNYVRSLQYEPLSRGPAQRQGPTITPR